MRLRRAGALLGWFVLFALANLAVWYTFEVGLRTLADRHPGQTAGGFLLAAATPFLIMLANRTRAERALWRHAGTCGWETADPVGREWPWTDLRLRGTIRVLRAWSFESEGFPITAGEIKWTGNALAGAVEGVNGKGVFVIVHLPAPVPSMAMRNRFDRVGDSPLLDRPELRRALLNDEVSPWTARGRTLFTIERRQTWLRPPAIEGAVHRALRVVELLDLNGEGRTHP